MKLHHIGKVVKNLEEEILYYKNVLHLTHISEPVIDPIQRVKVAFVDVGFIGNPTIELLEPISEDSPVYKFLLKNGGLHHLCFEVADIDYSIKKFKQEADVIVLGKPVPGKGHQDRLTVWLYTSQKELIELLEEEKHG